MTGVFARSRIGEIPCTTLVSLITFQRFLSVHRTSVRVMQAEVLRAKVAAFRAAYDEVAACLIDTVTHGDLLPEMDELEALVCQVPTLRHRMLAQLQAQTTPRELGAKSWREVVMTRWRLSGAEASR